MALKRLYLPVVVLSARARAGLPEAIAYLEEEVPKWKRDNKCYSCHNNGDGARALFTAIRLNAGARRDPVEDTVQGLLKPESWEPKTLAAVQFGASLLAAERAGMMKDGAMIRRVAEMLVKAQSADGHWQVEEEKVTGAPATYGPEVGTALALEVVERAGMRESAGRARAWLQSRRVESSLAAAGVLMAGVRRGDAIESLARQQLPNGSWVNEPFDTAAAVIALVRAGAEPERVKRGRAWLLDHQSGGGWPSTTRPPGGDSYAQHISTTAWSVLALLEPGPLGTESSGSRR